VTGQKELVDGGHDALLDPLEALQVLSLTHREHSVEILVLLFHQGDLVSQAYDLGRWLLKCCGILE
jgi:hypothetical protein